MPLAVETPMRKPVYEPGPALTATASHGRWWLRQYCSISSMKTGNLEACDIPSAHTRDKHKRPSCESAAEQTVVDVSMCRIVAMI